MKSVSTFVLLLLSSAILLAQAAPATPKTTTAPAKKAASEPAKAAPAKTAPGQAKPVPAASTDKQAPTKAVDASTISADATVLTINGLCANGVAKEACKRIVTKGEFDKLVSAINPNLKMEERRSLATRYMQLLAEANEGEKAGVDKSPSFAEQLRLERLKILAQAVENALLATSKPTDQQVETFYTENSVRFEELSLFRIVVPKIIGTEAKPTETKAMADKARDRALAGEDTDKIEADVFVAVKAPGAPPSTSLGWKRRGAMDPRHEPQIVPLKAGELSGVLEDAQNYYIYKVDSKRMIPLATVKEDIERGLQSLIVDAKIRNLLSTITVDYNETYFGPPPPPPPAAQQPQPTTPPKQ